MKVRAVYSAALKAHKILNNPKETNETQQTLTAIKQINKLYNQ